MNDLLTALYLSNAAIAAIAYLPQCYALWVMLKSDTVNKGVSLMTWGLWCWACGVNALYAFVVSDDDTAFKTISAINASFCFLTFLLTACVHRRCDQQQQRGQDDE